MKTKIICLILILTLLVGSTQLFAASKSQLNSQSSELDDKISQKKDEIEEIDEQLSESMKEVQSLYADITSYEQAIEDLNSQINTVTAQIEETSKNIEQKEKDLTEKQALLDKRLVALYESGNVSYIELLLTSADLSDFISKYYLISEIATYDTELIQTIKTAKAELETAKASLETNKTNLETAKAEQVKKQDELKALKKEKDTKVANLTAEEKALEKELAVFEADKKEIEEELARIAREEEEARRQQANNSSSGTTVSSAPSSYGYIFPVAGLSKSNIRVLKYPSYSGHTGVDVNINVTGKSVVAVKSGTVVTSTAMKTASGAYKSYGEYVVINHHDGTMTLYAHMLANSRQVIKGQQVSQGQVLGTVGSTGNSTGTHLHFEVRVNGRCVNPIPYLP